MPSIVFIYVGNIKVCLDSIGGGFYIVFGVAFIDRHMFQCDNYCGGNISRISLLFYGKVGVYKVQEVFVLSFGVVLS